MTFDSNKFNAIVATAKSRTTNRRWIAAIEKAAKGLTTTWIVTELYNSILITTENGTYHVNGHCNCKAATLGTPCKHRAAKRLIELYNEAPNPGASERETLIAEIKTTWFARFPGESLADALMYRFRVNSLNFLNTDFLRRILDVIA